MKSRWISSNYPNRLENPETQLPFKRDSNKNQADLHHKISEFYDVSKGLLTYTHRGLNTHPAHEYIQGARPLDGLYFVQWANYFFMTLSGGNFFCMWEYRMRNALKLEV